MGKRKIVAAMRVVVLAVLITSCLPVKAWQKFFNLTSDEVSIDSILPVFMYYLPVGANYADSTYTVKLKYPEYIEMSAADVKRYQKIKGDYLPGADVEVDSRMVVERKKGVLAISFVPIVYRDGKLQKLVSFMIDVSTGVSTSKVRSATGDTRSYGTIYADHSVLAEGTWAKIRVPETGIYELTSSLIKNAGFSDLSKIRIYGYGGAKQDDLIDSDYLAETDDLPEVATCTVNGRRLFYAQGPVSYGSKATSSRVRNPYSDYGYYFITESDDEPLTMDSAEFVASIYPSYDDYHSIRELDEYAWYSGGRNLYESATIASGASSSYIMLSSGYDTTGRLGICVSSGTESTVTIAVNDSTVGTLTLTYDDEYDFGDDASGSYKLYNLKDSNTVTVTATSGGPLRMDYIVLQYSTPRDLPDLATADFDVPEYVYGITNQDLHADEGYDMVIIVPASQELTSEAEKIKAIHEEYDGLSVRIVPADELYNEFSSGTPDANAYRRYMKMLYDRAGSDDDAMPKYLLLFGDCAWDNRMNSSAWSGYDPDDFLLCYESENSFSDVDSYVNEGFFGCLDDGEGGSPLSSDKMDIAVGRFPVRTATEAAAMVDKTISYIENENAGAWQNIVMFMGDDGNDNAHMEDADEMATLVEEIDPGLNVKRVMWDAYEAEVSATGNSYPDVTDIITEQQEAGALMMNYIGHASEQSLSHEKVLMLSDFQEFTNTNLPLWVTATCDIAPFDGQADNIGETLVLNDAGGAVALYGTARTVYINRNMAMNTAFCTYLFTPNDDGSYNSIGEATRLAKNWLITNKEDQTVNKLQYALLGDPALMLNIPQYDVVVDSINGIAADDSTNMAQLKATGTAVVKGHIERDGELYNTFNGTVALTVLDSEELIECRLNDTSDDGASEAFTYYDRQSTIFNGTDSISDGEFNITFAVPLDINYSNETGRMTFFAYDTSTLETANGATENFIVGGTDSNFYNNDSIGPSIYCWLNSSSFTNGDDVDPTPYFYAYITDDDGINLSDASIGHEMTLQIDGNRTLTYYLNDNFTYDTGSYTSGSTYYNIPELEAGEHELMFRAWDIYNNSSKVYLTFNVVDGLDTKIFSVGVSRNPASSTTRFIINTDRIGDEIDVQIDVFDTSGRILWSHEESGISSTSTYTIDWDLTTDSGYKLQTGVYLYRVYVSSESTKRTSQTKKLVIINNN